MEGKYIRQLYLIHCWISAVEEFSESLDEAEQIEELKEEEKRGAGHKIFMSTNVYFAPRTQFVTNANR